MKRFSANEGVMRWLTIFLFLILQTEPKLSFSQTNIKTFTPQSEAKQSLDKQLYFLDDQDGAFTIDQVIKEKSEAFTRLLPSKELGYKYKAKVLWLRITIDFRHYKESNWFLSYDYEHIGNLKVFYPTAYGYQMKEMDETFSPAEGRNFIIRDYVFKLPTPEASEPVGVYYVRLMPHSRYLRVGLSWSGIKGTFESLQESEFAYGLYFGALLVLWLYNFSLYLYLKDRAYLYYVYYLGCFIATFFHIYGFSTVLMRLNPLWEQIFAACGYGTIHGMVIFSRHFLLLKKTNKKIDKYLEFFQWILVVGGVAAFFQPVGKPFEILNYLILLIFPVIILAAVMRWRQGYEPARIYSFGWILFAISLALLSMRSIELIPTTFVSIYAIRIAAVWEAVLFSLALGYRIKLIEKEKNDALEGERARLEKRVAERTESLRASLEARRMMLANASHELRSPVNALRLLLDSNPQSAPEDHKIIPNVAAIAAHMSQLVENLLLLDADQPAKQGGLVQDFDLGDEIRATANMLGPLRHGSLAIFNIDVEPCLGLMVRGDLTSLRRIIINLLSNAFKFTETGTVSLQARPDVTSQRGKIAFTIRVSDTGSGIRGSMHDQIFDAFVTSGLHGKHIGTGLGLAISRQLALNLDGSLTLVKSDVNAGSEFELQASFAAASSKSLTSATSDDQSKLEQPSHRLKVLVAEDDPITAKAVQIIVRRLRHEVVHVANYDDLYQALNEISSPFDVALIDHRLPGGNGFDIIKRCRSMGIASATRMILVTADVTPEVLAAAKTVCDDIVTKPTSALILQQLLGVGAVPRQPRRHHEIVDFRPLTMLNRCGAKHAALVKMCDAFNLTVHETLDEIKAMLAMPDTPHPYLASLGNIVHRIRSSCSTIGAVALDVELQELLACENSLAAKKQYAIVVEVLTSTRQALRELLSTIETYESSR